MEQLLDGLGLGDHEKAERRVNRLFLPLRRDQQRATIEAMLGVATTMDDHTTQLLTYSLLEAVGRLDPMLIEIEDVKNQAVSADFSLRSSAAVVMWQWAESIPGRVPIPLLGRLSQPSTEDWYVHAAARAGANQLLLHRAATRAVFDRMAASRAQDDWDYAARTCWKWSRWSRVRYLLISPGSWHVTRTDLWLSERPSCCVLSRT
ncbi:hypothetical protein [Streptomyces sp. NPDC048277]|uniref:hypothetical protein n=1 Tax=Streptomyces sp. NPDC048277 TaxID=3155027 RepID=UPI0033E246AE